LDVAIRPDPVDGTGRVIRSLQPVVATASGRAVGVLELYLPYDEIEAQSERQLHDTYVRLAWGLGLLWLVLAVISWSSSRSLRRQALLREHEALHDSLTGLPNRAAFLAALDRALAGAPARDRRPARPRRLQGGERHARPRHRRRPPQRGGGAPARGPRPR
jgi:hypothetical protein